jgi:probable HAF family extracellular repeat protein
MTDLGALGTFTDSLLNTSNPSYALGISKDGSVIVGFSFNGTVFHAFKYVGTAMTDLGALGTFTDSLLNTSNDSCANAVSADGSVIVGHSYNGTVNHAFKYVGTTMTDLGALGANPVNESKAYGVSADGSVIVGYSDTDTATHAFVYTDAGMVDVVEWMRSISGPAGILPMVNSLTSLPMEGAHHRPLMSLDMMGKKSQSWVTGDFGARSRTSDSHTTSGEAGVSGTFGDVIAGVAVGYGEQNNDLLFGGSSHISGQYILGEVDMRLSDNESIVSITTMIGNWKSKTLRGYGVGGGGVDYSLGSTNLNSASVRLRFDGAPHKLIRGPSITPFASFTWSRTTADAYSESGGSYDAQFNKQSHVSKEGRVGLSTNFKLSKSTTLLTTLEWIHRFDKSESGFSGTDIDHGALPFSVSGSAIRSNQARLGFDVDHKVNPTTMLNFSAHVTSVGEAPDVSTALSLRRAF